MARSVSISGSEAAEATKGFAPLPEGEYIATIVDLKEKKSKNGDPILEAQFKITESGTGEGVGRKIKDFSIPLVPKWKSGSTAFTFFLFFEALGVKFPAKGETVDVELPDDEDILGEEIGLYLITEPRNDGAKDEDGNPLKQNRIRRYFAASKGVKDSSAAAADDDFSL